MAWLYLFLAGASEIVWAGLLKHTHGFTRLGPTVLLLVAMATSVAFLALAARTLPIGLSYAIWCGIGIIGTTLTGYLIYGEALSAGQLACIGMIGAGVIGLKLVS
ncbi:multidrug transporter [Haematobacter missouriensis]|uniref:Guanidinium exporter n=1 Tax=Haematobacter missouriensis TaxID=366616 RepID=A0A212AU42_9RHOB|nr:multidrug efflux SMR transporter [Haematobacter missouriensis]KFI33306.1 multidrug transporter [Haematobacter missouriensis]OWJ79522.1 QacE family quaternary ammonium compound efflux SMR transporter [Haematobacter missouriensis]OWJ84998.1 QacE family quaternary ammonium compound efflux SMR transporter [Haematobacter missouriensis]